MSVSSFWVFILSTDLLLIFFFFTSLHSSLTFFFFFFLTLSAVSILSIAYSHALGVGEEEGKQEGK